MSGLDDLFAGLWSSLESSKDADFQAFPGDKKGNLEGQPSDFNDVSSVSRISSAKTEPEFVPEEKITQARAHACASGRARVPNENRLETLEPLEKVTPAGTCLSSSLSRNLERLEKKGGGPGPLAAADGLALWRAGLARLDVVQPPCPGYRAGEWPCTLERALRFLDEFGDQAAALGWTAPRLFGSHPEIGIVRGDWCGALVLPIGGPVRAITATEINFGPLTHRVKPGQIQGPVWWEWRR